ncbi:UDP-N-acetylglucosamine 4-epimerase (UDP-GlcNAc 4-epimerase) [Escherichia coli]|uniref:UDP-N-acetylglucosamine 4-epimerase (UDP-GlcNAc 4-epimerase) n=1 Tax=Escherichia coli TaxID=562 RepID=A0A376W663_ECOLX|nr:UDP-N-acetylglucosamine 4-epimerase (UDP-GlcNAc 4-epimerase) [Escherichia coli]
MHLPYPLGMLGGYCFDILSKNYGQKIHCQLSAREKNSAQQHSLTQRKCILQVFVAPYTLSQGLDRTLQYEFVHAKKDDITFVSE